MNQRARFRIANQITKRNTRELFNAKTTLNSAYMADSHQVPLKSPTFRNMYINSTFSSLPTQKRVLARALSPTYIYIN